ncbi:cytochrome b [Aliikangiella coralliicola]|uniref:Cytochrome b n=1 Tax=Aliikangiella coralliicola TaxID=2592383 RepID=A0A545UIF8_9GAMM|nr:cytochrome b [Aliikangiella coralliicola]TQV89254.1 cytochrome b [Aliikangiella coralliicola]
MLKNTPNSYGTLGKTFHWLSAVIVIGLFALGWWMVDLTYYSEWYQTAPFYHESFGILFAILLISRFIVILSQGKPEPIASQAMWEKRSATIAHNLLYLLMFILIITGFLISTADHRGINVFGLFEIPPLFDAFDNQEDIAGDIHEWSAYVLIAIAVIHTLGALKHHFIDKDETLKRML